MEIYFRGSWGTVCDDRWDIRDARVVCRQLGYSSAVSAPKRAHFGQGTGIIWLSQVSCQGDESSIMSCSYYPKGVQVCSHRDDASVICSRKHDIALLFNLSMRHICFRKVFYNAERLYRSGLNQSQLLHCSKKRKASKDTIIMDYNREWTNAQQ